MDNQNTPFNSLAQPAMMTLAVVELHLTEWQAMFDKLRATNASPDELARCRRQMSRLRLQLAQLRLEIKPFQRSDN